MPRLHGWRLAMLLTWTALVTAVSIGLVIAVACRLSREGQIDALSVYLMATLAIPATASVISILFCVAAMRRRAAKPNN